MQNSFSFFGIPSEFPFQVTNLLFLLIPIAKALIDVYLFQKRNREIHHSAHIAFAILVGVIFMFIDWRVSPVTYLWQSGLIGVATFWLFFDYIRNLMAGEHIFYVDYNGASDPVEDSWWDTEIYPHMTPMTILILKVWFALVAYSVYYLSYLI